MGWAGDQVQERPKGGGSYSRKQLMQARFLPLHRKILDIINKYIRFQERHEFGGGNVYPRATHRKRRGEGSLGSREGQARAESCVPGQVRGM